MRAVATLRGIDTPSPTARPPVEVLVVCTGNLCRSPMAEGLLRERLAARGVPACVRSAGLVTEEQPASKHSVGAMARRGIDISAHRSQRLRPDLVRDADLVLGMERRHVREAVVLEPTSFPRTYTIPEIVRRARTVGPRSADESLEHWLERVGAGRRPTDLLGAAVEDDVEDPIGQSSKRYEATAVLLEDLVIELVDHLFPQE